jgi:hypothetical protein
MKKTLKIINKISVIILLCSLASLIISLFFIVIYALIHGINSDAPHYFEPWILLTVLGFMISGVLWFLLELIDIF